jgi:hypothetical protein
MVKLGRHYGNACCLHPRLNASGRTNDYGHVGAIAEIDF